MTDAYGPDLAHVHDTGFGRHAHFAARTLLKLLRQQKKSGGLVVDLGCGSGILSEAVAAAGYGVLGFDQSAAMIELSRQRVHAGDFRQESFVSARFPPCVAVAAVGEVFNYVFDRRNTLPGLAKLFRRVHDALEPGGLFLFDVATPGRIPGPGPRRNFSEGDDWLCVYSVEEDRRRRLLTRRIVTFRREGAVFRRSDEIHRQKLYVPSELTRLLRHAGFRVRTIETYGAIEFPPGCAAFVAVKPVS